MTFFRYVFGTAFLVVPLIWRRPLRLDAAAVWANLPRGLVIAVTAAAFFWGLSVLPLAEAIVITFIAPLLIPPMAQLFLREKMRADAMVACAVGFAGVLLAVQGADHAGASPLRPWGLAAVLLSAVTYALSAILMRARAEKDGPLMFSLMGNIWPGVILSAPILILRPAFEIAALPGMALAGGLGALGIHLLSRAYARAQAQLLAVAEYTALGWASMLGWAMFAELPRWQTLAGGLIIAAAALWLARRSRAKPAGHGDGASTTAAIS